MKTLPDQYALLSGRDQLLNSSAFPDWCDLSALMTLSGKGDVEKHYHHYEEIWLWQGGHAEAILDGVPVSMRAGMLAYTPGARQHSFNHCGDEAHSLTLIVPRIPADCHWGHLHLEQTQETLCPDYACMVLQPHETALNSECQFPAHAGFRSIRTGVCEKSWELQCARTGTWMAVLCDSGEITAVINEEDITAGSQQCLCIAAGNSVCLKADPGSKIIIVEGRL